MTSSGIGLMDILVFGGVPLLGSVFLMVVIFKCIEQIGVRDGTTNIGKWRTPVVASYIVISVAISLLGNGILNLIMLLFIPLIGNRFYNRERQQLFYYFLFVIIVFLTDIVCLLGLSYLLNSGILSYNNPHIITLITIVALRFTEYAMLKLCTAAILRRKAGTISGRQLLSAFILPIFSIVNLFTLMYFLDIYIAEDRIILLMVNLLLLLGLNFYFSHAFEAISRNNRLEKEMSLYLQQQAIQTRYYESIEHKYDLTRGLVHDMRSHIQGMQQFYKAEQNHELVTYTDDLHTMLNRLGQRYYTSNKMLNIILNDKVETMLAHGIEADIKIADVDFTFMRNVDITTIFSNILDNGITAARADSGMGEETSAGAETALKRTIILRAVHVHNFVSITLQNTAPFAPIPTDDFYLSSKENHQGYGLKNVKRVVEMYKGNVQFEWRDHYFFTRIMLTI